MRFRTLFPAAGIPLSEGSGPYPAIVYFHGGGWRGCRAGVDDRVVAAGSGEYWHGDAAWLMALEDYRGWSYRLGSPTLLPPARQMFATLSENRHRAAMWFGLQKDELAERLRDVGVPGCSR